MPKRGLSNPLALAVLALLFERPMHPYEIAQVLRERRKHESIKLNYGSLYAVVDSLLERGLIAANETVREGRRPERTVYALTDAGRAELRAWMRDLLSTPAREFTRFEAGLALLPVLPPEEAAKLLDERTRRLDEEIGRARAELEAGLRQGLPRLFLIEAEYRLALREAERRWVAELAGLIADEASDFARPWREWHTGQTVVAPDARDAPLAAPSRAGDADGDTPDGDADGGTPDGDVERRPGRRPRRDRS